MIKIFLFIVNMTPNSVSQFGYIPHIPKALNMFLREFFPSKIDIGKSIKFILSCTFQLRISVNTYSGYI